MWTYPIAQFVGSDIRARTGGNLRARLGHGVVRNSGASAIRETVRRDVDDAHHHGRLGIHGSQAAYFSVMIQTPSQSSPGGFFFISLQRSI